MDNPLYWEHNDVYTHQVNVFDIRPRDNFGVSYSASTINDNEIGYILWMKPLQKDPNCYVIILQAILN